MPLGEEGDFRTVGFQMKPMFPGQDQVGGTGSPMLRSFTPPQGRSNNSLPVPGLTVPALNFPGITFPGITFPNQLPPVSISGLGGGGTGTVSPVKVYGAAGSTTTSPTDATEILFQGTALNDVSVAGGVATVTYNSSGGGGSTLVYGYITGGSRITAGVAAWTYNITLYSGSTITARNLFERGNTSSKAYGYNISGGVDRIANTSYYVYPVPVNTWVRLEQTSGVDGSTGYWFEAPNYINGGCT
jgi:hypothetical protein